MTAPEPQPDELARIAADMHDEALALALDRPSIVFTRDHRHDWLLCETARRLLHEAGRRHG